MNDQRDYYMTLHERCVEDLKREALEWKETWKNMAEMAKDLYRDKVEGK